MPTDLCRFRWTGDTSLPAHPVRPDWISLCGVPGYNSLVEETTSLLGHKAGAAEDRAMRRLIAIFDISTRYESEFEDTVYFAPS